MSPQVEFCSDMYAANVQFFGGVCFACLLLMTMLSFRSVYSTDQEEANGGQGGQLQHGSKSTEMSQSQYV